MDVDLHRNPTTLSGTAGLRNPEGVHAFLDVRTPFPHRNASTSSEEEDNEERHRNLNAADVWDDLDNIGNIGNIGDDGDGALQIPPANLPANPPNGRRQPLMIVPLEDQIHEEQANHSIRPKKLPILHMSSDDESVDCDQISGGSSNKKKTFVT